MINDEKCAAGLNLWPQRNLRPGLRPGKWSTVFQNQTVVLTSPLRTCCPSISRFSWSWSVSAKKRPWLWTPKLPPSETTPQTTPPVLQRLDQYLNQLWARQDQERCWRWRSQRRKSSRRSTSNLCVRNCRLLQIWTSCRGDGRSRRQEETRREKVRWSTSTWGL